VSGRGSVFAKAVRSLASPRRICLSHPQHGGAHDDETTVEHNIQVNSECVVEMHVHWSVDLCFVCIGALATEEILAA